MPRFLKNKGIGDPEGPALASETILEELQKSDRWGINAQPVDPEPLAEFLAKTRSVFVQMKGDDTCIVKFDRPLTDAEKKLLVEIAQQDLSPFHESGPVLDVLLWWD